MFILCNARYDREKAEWVEGKHYVPITNISYIEELYDEMSYSVETLNGIRLLSCDITPRKGA